jgi:hypothetical protein
MRRSESAVKRRSARDFARWRRNPEGIGDLCCKRPAARPQPEPSWRMRCGSSEDGRRLRSLRSDALPPSAFGNGGKHEQAARV